MCFVNIETAPKSVSDAVSATLAFFDIFDFPLKIGEIQEYLLGMDADAAEIKEELKHYAYKDGFYFIKGREIVVKSRLEKEEIAKKYWKKVRRFAPLFQLLPFVRMVAVCNSLAFDNATRESDIDLFIVTKNGRIFIARTLAALLFAILGIRRHGSKIAGRFCLSFFVTENGMDLESVRLKDGDIYMPFWLLTLKPLFGKRTYEEFISKNSWIRRKIMVGDMKLKEGGLIQKLGEFILNGVIGDRLERWLEEVHVKRHKKRIFGAESSVIVTKNMLKFHNIDKRAEFNEKYMRIHQGLKQL